VAFSKIKNLQSLLAGRQGYPVPIAIGTIGITQDHL
jgi:hypothetical protein